MKPLEEESYQQHMLRKINLHDTASGFPRLQDYGLTKSEVDDYLSEKQDILDIPGSQTHRLTVLAGIVMVCTLIASVFDHADTCLGTNASLAGIIIGVVLSLSWWGLTTVRVNRKLKAQRDDNIENYLKAVENY